jgi:hypothetical protein
VTSFFGVTTALPFFFPAVVFGRGRGNSRLSDGRFGSDSSSLHEDEWWVLQPRNREIGPILLGAIVVARGKKRSL